MKLKKVAKYVTEKISSEAIGLDCYVTTDSLLQNKAGRVMAANLPPKRCQLTRFRKGDVLISNIRPYLKKIWMADVDGGCNADVLVLRAQKSHSPEFVYAVLLQDAFYEYVMKGAKGSKMPRGDKEQIMRYEIPVRNPAEVSVGKFIAGIMDKIALLTRINFKLEAMARQLYDYWFLQCDFPDKNGRPYKSCGGSMVWNEMLKRDIPEGWSVIPIASNIKTGKEDANFASPDGVYPFFTCAQQTLRCDKNAFCGSAILIAGNGDFNVKHYTGAFNAYQRTYVLIPEIEYYGLSYFASLDRINSFKSESSGSIIKYITKKDIENIVIAVPPASDAFSYGIINECIFECEKNLIQIEALQRLRDDLLPLLMNGQISIC